MALDVYANPTGLKFAEAQAKSIGGLLALGRFAWQEFLHPSTSPQGDAPSPDETEPLLFTGREQNHQSETTWRNLNLTKIAETIILSLNFQKSSKLDSFCVRLSKLIKIRFMVYARIATKARIRQANKSNQSFA